MQLLANGLRLAVRTRLEVLDKYRGVMAQESSRLARSKDPAEALGKLHPLGSRILESIRTIVLEAELQGTNLNAPPANLFHDDAKQATYETIRNRFRSWFEDFRDVTSREDKELEGKYIQTEQLLDELYDLNKKYIAIAAPTFLNMLEASHQQPDDRDDNDVPLHPSPGPGVDDPSLITMRETVGTLCSVIEAGAIRPPHCWLFGPLMDRGCCRLVRWWACGSQRCSLWPGGSWNPLYRRRSLGWRCACPRRGSGLPGGR